MPTIMLRTRNSFIPGGSWRRRQGSGELWIPYQESWTCSWRQRGELGILHWSLEFSNETINGQQKATCSHKVLGNLFKVTWVAHIRAESPSLRSLCLYLWVLCCLWDGREAETMRPLKPPRSFLPEEQDLRDVRCGDLSNVECLWCGGGVRGLFGDTVSLLVCRSGLIISTSQGHWED